LKGNIDPDIKIGDVTISSPTLMKIENTILILACNGELFSEYKKIWKDKSSENIILNLLKKRHLSPIFNLNKKIYDDDIYTVDIVPDIFVSSNFDKPGYMNYKGTTIISNGSFLLEPIYWLINLKTRETIKICFA
jgi:DNA polymerase II small subunit/DNA polymerase delta subunit B